MVFLRKCERKKVHEAVVGLLRLGCVLSDYGEIGQVRSSFILERRQSISTSLARFYS